jgi:pimeloyl-ACP methyl ester carboxylesterase
MNPFRHGRSAPASPAAPSASTVVLLLAALLSTLLLTACPGYGPVSPTSASRSADVQAAAARPVTFSTEDGIALSGHVFGSGSEGVILSHMYPADQTSWYPTAERLAQEGYLVLTFDFRGYGDSGGDKEISLIDGDVTAAVSEIRRQGASAVVLTGASMGGTASLIAGDQAQQLSSIRLAGIATLSAPVEFQGLDASSAVPDLIVPLMFIAAENDVGAAGARQLEQLSSGRGRLEIVPGNDHGTDLLSGAQGEKVYALLSDFIKSCLAP